MVLLSAYASYAVYWRNPETRSMERIPIVQLIQNPDGELRVTMNLQRPPSHAAAGKWYTISKLWVRE